MVKIVEDYGTHKCYDEYTHDPDMFCPSCGHKKIWISKEIDFYEGPTHICISCKCSFTMPSGPKELKETGLDIVKQIKEFLK